MMRSFASVLLSLVLAISSLTMAVARAQAAAGTTTVICSGYGVTTITVDSAGNTSGTVHPCPDCLAAGAALLQDGAPRVQRPLAASGRISPPQWQPGQGTARPTQLARGPPPLV